MMGIVVINMMKELLIKISFCCLGNFRLREILKIKISRGIKGIRLGNELEFFFGVSDLLLVKRLLYLELIELRFILVKLIFFVG